MATCLYCMAYISDLDHNIYFQEIHKKIMSLNFRDCHAKIRQVDSQATVGNAVVVQVIIVFLKQNLCLNKHGIHWVSHWAFKLGAKLN